MQRKPKRLRTGVKQAGTKVKDYLWKTLLHWRTSVSLLLLELKTSSHPCTASAAESWRCIEVLEVRGGSWWDGWILKRTSQRQQSYRECEPNHFLYTATENMSICPSSWVTIEDEWGVGGTRMKIGILLEVWVQITFKTKNETRILYWNKGYAAKVKMNTEQLRRSVSVGPERDKKALWLPWLHTVWWVRKNPDTGAEVTGCNPCFIPC